MDKESYRPFGCEKCGAEHKGTVIDSRYVFDLELRDYTVIRRRECPTCGGRWTTVEINKNAYYN